MMLAILRDVSRWYWDLSACQNTTHGWLVVEVELLTEEEAFPNNTQIFVDRVWYPIFLSNKKFNEFVEAFVSDALFYITIDVSIDWRKE